MINVVSLVENTSTCGCKTAHGLSLYISTPNHQILFDVGGDDTLLQNAKYLGINLSDVDTIIISHGHRDHGGALDLALSINTTARVYIQRQAFAPHLSHRPSGVGNIGLDTSLMSNDRVVMLDGDYEIDNELQLFTVSDNSLCPSSANSTLYEGDAPDSFAHEQNLIIRGEIPILVMGCGHNGVVNIMNEARRYSPQICVGGFHLTNPSARRDEPRELIDRVISHLEEYSNVEFYTCHCTGVGVYEYMRTKMSNIHYLACGDRLKV